MKYLNTLFLASAILLLAGCASTDYTAFDGSKVFRGDGGAKKVVNGVEIWTDGAPPRDFRIVGIINDTRKKAVIPMASFHSDIAKKAKEVGGDAAIIMSANVADVGTYFTPSTTYGTSRGTVHTSGSTGYYTGTSTFDSTGSQAIAIREQTSKIAVIRYGK